MGCFSVATTLINEHVLILSYPLEKAGESVIYNAPDGPAKQRLPAEDPHSCLLS